MKLSTGKVLWSVACLAIGIVAGLLLAYRMQATAEPSLQAWHRPALGDDCCTHGANESFDVYLKRENVLFERLAAEVGRRETHAGERVFDRYHPTSPSNPATYPHNWNRTFELEVESPRAGALLIHGLSDSPYSMRAVGELLHERGFHVVGLRVPGHGTTPGELTGVSWQDWSEAVAIGARHVAQRVGAQRPLWIVGYSNGAALAMDYTLAAIEGSDDPVPTRLVFLSPALSVAPVAGLARARRRLAALPGLETLAWLSNRPEFDPYKYSSFPVRAAEEIHDLTSDVGRRLERLESEQLLDALPPLLVFQSVVDSTIPPAGVVDRLLSRLEPGQAELVLFDVNRNAPPGLLRDTSSEPFLHSLQKDASLPFGLTIVTNASPESRAVVAERRRRGASTWERTELDLAWPPMVYSLSHVAIPFPSDDSVYGDVGGMSAGGSDVINIGGLAARGERGLLALPTDLLMRLRYNPFFPYLAERLRQEADGG